MPDARLGDTRYQLGNVKSQPIKERFVKPQNVKPQDAKVPSYHSARFVLVW